MSFIHFFTYQWRITSTVHSSMMLSVTMGSACTANWMPNPLGHIIKEVRCYKLSQMKWKKKTVVLLIHFSQVCGYLKVIQHTTNIREHKMNQELLQSCRSYPFHFSVTSAHILYCLGSYSQQSLCKRLLPLSSKSHRTICRLSLINMMLVFIQCVTV